MRVKDEVFIPISLSNCVGTILLSSFVHLFLEWKETGSRNGISSVA